MSRRFQGGDRWPRRTVATYESYAEAEQAVDHLADHGFPVDRAAIIGRDLKLVEQVTGRMGYGRAALQGALAGAVVGVLIGWLFGVFDWFQPVVASVWLVIDGLWFGAAVGALMGLVGHALTGGRRDFSSIGRMEAERYDLVVDDPVADQAAALLGELTGTPPAGDTAAAAGPSASRTS
jgi:hypothetical protein